QGDTAQRITNDVLGQINLTGYEEGPMTVRVLVFDTAGNSAEQRVRFYLEKVEPTPEPEPDEGDAGQDEAGQQPVQPIQPGEGDPAEPTTCPPPSSRNQLGCLRGGSGGDDEVELGPTPGDAPLAHRHPLPARREGKSDLPCPAGGEGVGGWGRI